MIQLIIFNKISFDVNQKINKIVNSNFFQLFVQLVFAHNITLVP